MLILIADPVWEARPRVAGMREVMRKEGLTPKGLDRLPFFRENAA
jgi:hypothetical protein